MKCPNLVHKEKTLNKKKFSKNNKGKRAYIAWDENDSTRPLELLHIDLLDPLRQWV